MSNAAATFVRPKSMLALSNAGRPEGAGEGGGHASTKPESGHQLEGSGPEAALEVVPHQGLVAIDKPAGEARQYLVHCVTLERVPLDLGGDWFIEGDNGGWAAIADANDHCDPVVVQDLLARVLCVNPADGEQFVRRHQQQRGVRVWSLTQRMLQHQEVCVTVKLGPSWVKHKVGACMLQWPRCETRWFWSASSLYAALGLTCYATQPSKWFYNVVSGVQKNLAAIGFAGQHVLRSRLSSSGGDDDERATRGLPYGAFSTIALVAALNRWASVTPRRGGLRGETCSAAALWLLKSFARGAAPVAERNGARLDVRFTVGWRHMWPLSETSAQDLSLPVNGEGVVDLRPWQAELQGPSASPARLWRELQKAGVLQVCSDSVSLADLLVASAGNAQLPSFHGQVVHFVASRTEVAAFYSLRKGPLSANSFECANVNFMDLLSDPKRLDHELLKYCLAAHEAAKHSGSLFFSSDKANVGGLSLQNSILCFGSGVACVAPPQASRVCHAHIPKCVC